MQDDEIELRILSYLDRCWENKNYIVETINDSSFPQLVDSVYKLLKSNRAEPFKVAALFLRNTIKFAELARLDLKLFHDLYSISGIITVLEESIFSDNYFIRSESILTLGSTHSYGSKDVLISAFDKFRDSDPLLLSLLISAMELLEVPKINSYINSIVSSPSYLTRWSIVEEIHAAIHAEIPAWVETLRQDECELIRAETEYEYQTKIKSLQTPILSKAEQRQRAKEIQKIKPVMSFSRLRMQYCNHLFCQGLSQYTVYGLEGYVDELLAE
jgi:hypothetical protein